jgi:hypothetical protein
LVSAKVLIGKAEMTRAARVSLSIFMGSFVAHACISEWEVICGRLRGCPTDDVRYRFVSSGVRALKKLQLTAIPPVTEMGGMEESEVPLENVQEHLEHHAHEEKSTFVSTVAVTTAILATVAAVTSLLAGGHANEAMIMQIRSSDQWAHYQAKSIKASVLATKDAILEAQGHKADPKDEEKLAEYKKEQEELSKEAKEKQQEADEHLHRHELLAGAVTMLQVAIAVGAISALTKKKAFWYVSLAFGLTGVGFLLKELLVK